MEALLQRLAAAVYKDSATVPVVGSKFASVRAEGYTLSSRCAPMLGFPLLSPSQAPTR